MHMEIAISLGKQLIESSFIIYIMKQNVHKQIV